MATFKKKHGAYVRRGGAGGIEATSKQWEALVETMVIASCIDGSLAAGEAETLAALVLDTPGFDKLDNQGLARTVQTLASRIAKEGLEARVDAIAAAIGSLPRLCDEAFMLATMFVHWDGKVGDEEQTYLDQLQKALEISDERASHIDAVLTEWTEQTTQ